MHDLYVFRRADYDGFVLLIEKPSQLAKTSFIIFATVTVMIVLYYRPTECSVAIPSSMKKINLGYIIIVTTIKLLTLIILCSN